MSRSQNRCLCKKNRCLFFQGNEIFYRAFPRGFYPFFDRYENIQKN
jgi:hypothetical protein